MKHAVENLERARAAVDEMLAEGRPSLLSLRHAAYVQACLDRQQAERELCRLTDGVLLGETRSNGQDDKNEA